MPKEYTVKRGIPFARYLSCGLILILFCMIMGCAPTLEKFRTPYLQGDFGHAEKIGKKVKSPEDRTFALEMLDKTYALLNEAESGRLNYDGGKYPEAMAHFVKVIEIGEGFNPDWTPDTLKQVISTCRSNYAQILYLQLSELMTKKSYSAIKETRPNFDRYVTENEGRHNDLVSLYRQAEDSILQIESMIQEGDSLFGLGKYESAIISYQRALEMGPDYAETIYSKISKCESEMQKLVDEQVRKGEDEIDKNNPDTAIRHFNNAKEMAARNPKLNLDKTMVDRYLANAAAMKEEIRRKKAQEEAVKADKKENGEWLGPFVIDKSRRGQVISAKSHGELNPGGTTKWQGKMLIPDNDIVFFEIETNEGIQVNMLNRPGTEGPTQDQIEVNYRIKGLELWRTSDDYGKAWKEGNEIGRYILLLTNQEPSAVPYNVECVIYDSIDR
jgi:tetratricopeptide (TPR) repeat protein